MRRMSPWPAPPRPYFRSLTRGFKGRCPHCGEGRIFYRYLKVSAFCPCCSHDLDRYPADDGPAYFTILLVGHLVIVPTLILFAPLIWKSPAWMVVPALLIPVGLITLAALPRVKGAVIGVHYALDINRGEARMHTASSAE